MVKHAGREEPNESFKELLRRIEIYEAIKQTWEEERNEKENRPFWHTKLHEEKREVNDEYNVGKVELEYTLRQQIWISIETGEDEKYGNSSEHLN